MDKIDTATQTLELFARRIATKEPYKHPLQLACEDHGIGDLVIFLGQGDYPTMAGLADKARDDFDCAAAVILVLAAERDASRAREAELQAEVARLRAALEFYTVSENWCLGGPLDGNSGNFTGGPADAALSHPARKDNPHD